MRGDELLEAIGRQLFHHRRPQLRRRRRRICAETDEHKPQRDFHAHRIERMLAQVQVGETVPRRGREQRAVVTIGPTVVRARDAAAAPAGALEQTRAAVAADVTQRPDIPARITQHDHAVGAQLESDVVSGAGDLADVAGDLPARLENPLVLETRHLRMVVDPGRQSPRNRVGRGVERADGGDTHGALPSGI